MSYEEINIEEFKKTYNTLVNKNLWQKLPNRLGNGIHSAMRYMILDSGKMYRSLLIFATARIFAHDVEKLVNYAAAIELIHTYTLIHDDLPAMDNDDYRRGKLSCHKKYDEATAILTGSAMLTLAYEIMASAETNVDPHIKLKIIARISDLIGKDGTILGQYFDIHSLEKEKDRKKIDLLKTANLFIAAVEIVCIYYQVSDIHRESLRNFAENFGLQYQLMDDINDNHMNPSEININPNEILKNLDIFGNKALLLRKFTESLLVSNLL